jgi:hypothetical protein
MTAPAGVRSQALELGTDEGSPRQEEQRSMIKDADRSVGATTSHRVSKEQRTRVDRATQSVARQRTSFTVFRRSIPDEKRFFPGISVPVLTRRADCSLVALTTSTLCLVQHDFRSPNHDELFNELVAHFVGKAMCSSIITPRQRNCTPCNEGGSPRRGVCARFNQATTCRLSGSSHPVAPRASTSRAAQRSGCSRSHSSGPSAPDPPPASAAR